MGKTSIEWTDASWNPIAGCTELSPGCANCYAARITASRLSNLADYKGLTQRDAPEKIARPYGSTQYRVGKARWTGETRHLPMRLHELTPKQRPQRIFVCDMGDLFHEDVKQGWLMDVFAAMAAAPQHTYQLLTKRAARMQEWLTAFALVEQHRPLRDDFRWPWPNVWCGVSVENQHFADERIPQLLATPAAVRFISAEPLLGAVDLRFLQPNREVEINSLAGTHGVYRPHGGENSKLDWVICGGESGPHARPMHPDWARSLRDQCVSAGVPFFFKQWGEYLPYDQSGAEKLDSRIEVMSWTKCGKKKAGRLLDGREWSEFPK